MPRSRPLYLQCHRTRHNRIIWYVRIGKGPRYRVKGAYGSDEFNAAYQEAYFEAVSGRLPKKAGKPKSGSLKWLVEQYRQSSAWSTKLSLATRRQRENILKHVLEVAGNEPFADISRMDIIDGRERRKETPAQANNFIKAMRGLFKWAMDEEYAEFDPTADVDWLSVKSDGFHTWTEYEVEKFEAKWPLGTRERVAFDVLLYTGLRRGDAVRLGPAHVYDGIFTIETEKTRETIAAPVLAPLAETIKAGPVGKQTFIAGEKGSPMVKESFGTWFRYACNAAGVPGSAHGLRKAGATRAANNGATEAELEAMYGWRGGRMAAIYTKKANRSKLAKGAMNKLLGKKVGDSISNEPKKSPKPKK